MLLRRISVAVFSLALLTSGCGQNPSHSSDTQDLAWNGKTAKNLAMFFTAPRPVNNSRVYIDNDPERLMESLTRLDQRFTYLSNEAATSAAVSGWLRTKIGPENLSHDGTLFLYIAGHGSSSGSAQMSDGSFVDFRKVSEAIKVGRNGKPLKRLVLMVFGCYSGSWINRIKSTGFQDIAEELFVLTSSAANQLSYSGGTNSQLTSAFHATLAAYAQNPSGITLKQFADGIRSRVRSSTPQYFAYPVGVLSQTLFSQDALESYLNKAN